MKCKDCKYPSFVKGNGSPSRYYCNHPDLGKLMNCGAALVSRCDRSSNELKIKNSPKWCPLKEVSNG